MGPSRARVIEAFDRPGDFEQAVAISYQVLGVMNEAEGDERGGALRRLRQCLRRSHG